MTKLWFGPSGVPSKDTPEEAIAILQERGYSACEIDFERGFWMEKPWAERFGQLARDADIKLSVHAPLAAFMGHAEKGKKFKMALGMLDHTAGLAVLAGADPVVIHPGFLLGRERAHALDDVVDQLTELRERLEGKGRAVGFGIEVMGRVRELGTAEDCFNVAARLPWVRPVLDFAHLHAVTDGAFGTADSFGQVLRLADQLMQPDDRIHIHFSDIQYANQNETKHLPYGEGTLRADGLGEALATIDRPAVVISESPDERSHQEIRAVLFSAVAAPTS